ncbi:MAG: hypothetical protein IPN65_08705 [Elusimicrobia bacterium]|jgi:hypothetical protein|nr:hypothetical protein [Elusimicrobiota bacterium]MBK7207877.1 hypothetical protein [Elusimicrobiota bacterium]MBK7544639.1 hypothetical protein [Elusimicrobiota bacterium]MBK7574171.1 hypothetical protein [Elusimicrobiota bacterium]MBK7688888.1 hypothetical protein [Elusimicrobiota bacterium]
MRLWPAALLSSLSVGLAAVEPGAPFLAVPPSARVEATGGLWAFAGGMETLSVNPALLGVDKSPWQFYSSAGQWGEDVQTAHAALGRAHARRPWGVAVTHLRSDGGGARDALGGGSGASVGVQDTALSVGAARSPNGRFAFGAAAKVFQSKLGSYRSDPGWAVDLGAAWRGDAVTAGFAWRNAGPGVRFVRQRDPLPQTVDAQLAWRRGPVTLAAGGQWDVPRRESRILAGGEAQLGALSFRGGYAVLEGDSSDTEGFERASLGFGLALPNRLQLDYALRPGGDAFGAFHRLALTWTWGEKKPKKPTAPAARPSSVFKKAPVKQAPKTVPTPPKVAPKAAPEKKAKPAAKEKPVAPEKPKRPRIGEGGYRLGG